MGLCGVCVYVYKRKRERERVRCVYVYECAYVYEREEKVGKRRNLLLCAYSALKKLLIFNYRW